LIAHPKTGPSDNTGTAMKYDAPLKNIVEETAFASPGEAISGGSPSSFEGRPRLMKKHAHR